MLYRTRFGYFLDQNREVLASEPACPAVEHALDIFPMVKLDNPLDHLRDAPVFLKAVAFDPQKVSFGKVGLPDAGDAGGQLVGPGIVVDLRQLILFERVWILQLGAMNCWYGGFHDGVGLLLAVEEGWVVEQGGHEGFCGGEDKTRPRGSNDC